MLNRLIFRNIELKNNIMTAPLAGYTDIPWRKVMKDMGAGVVFTEMISVEALSRDRKKTFDMLEKKKEYNSESVLCVQLFGNNIEAFRKSLEILENDFDFPIININMGCPVPKVLKAKAGCYYLKELDQAVKVISEVRKMTDKVLCIKTRLGVREGTMEGLEIAKICEDNGVDFIIIHARTFRQMFSGSTDLRALAEIKSRVSIPVIGNGDIRSIDDVKLMSDMSGVDGFMIGRGLFGNPGLISEISGNKFEIEITEFFKSHFRNMIEYYGEDKAYRNIKKFIPYYNTVFSRKDKIALLNSLSYHDFIKNLKIAGIIL